MTPAETAAKASPPATATRVGVHGVGDAEPPHWAGPVVVPTPSSGMRQTASVAQCERAGHSGSPFRHFFRVAVVLPRSVAPDA